MAANPQSRDVLFRYAQQLNQLATLAARRSNEAWLQIDHQNPGPGVQLAVGQTVVVITAAQRQAATLSQAYASAYAATEIEAVLEEEPLVPAGETWDGRSVIEPVTAVRGKFWSNVTKGVVIGVALQKARLGISRVAHTETHDAARRQLSGYKTHQGLIVGWRWTAIGDTCLACLSAANGRIRPTNKSLNGHPSCNCIEELVFDGATTDPRLVPTGEQIFKNMPESQQDALYGPKIAKALRDGKAPFTAEHLTDRQSSRKWRSTITSASQLLP